MSANSFALGKVVWNHSRNLAASSGAWTTRLAIWSTANAPKCHAMTTMGTNTESIINSTDAAGLCTSFFHHK